MLISFRYKFIFVANLKTASGSIEGALRPFADVALTGRKVSKHMDVRDIQKRFAFIFRKISYDEFLVFGVIRNPLTYMLSLYNFHTLKSFDGRPHSTKGMSFREFLDTWMSQNSWMVRPQHERFTDEHGQYKVNYLIDFDRLSDQMSMMFRDAYGLLEPLHLGRHNVSPKVMGTEDLDPFIIECIRDTFREDERAWKELSGSWIGSKPMVDTSTAYQFNRAVRDYNEAERRLAAAGAVAETGAKMVRSSLKKEVADLREEIDHLRVRLAALEAEKSDLRDRLVLAALIHE